MPKGLWSSLPGDLAQSVYQVQIGRLANELANAMTVLAPKANHYSSEMPWAQKGPREAGSWGTIQE